MGAIDDRIAALGFTIPEPPPPGGSYANAVQSGSLVFLSGAIGTEYRDGKWSLPIRGRVGDTVDIEQGRQSARLCVINHLAALRSLALPLDRVQRIVKLTGYVHAAPEFTKAPLVLDGASELLLAIFGSSVGLHARTAVYQHTMSFNVPIETDLIVEMAVP